ncbi:hypothetical protein KY289_000728 [Solanum tuberosum]|nr:hypothetical protein KY289_000728 [Solanum tuberosum]
MVTSWLLNSLSKKITNSVIYSKTTEALWKDLEGRFGYYTKLKGLWDELDLLNTKNYCSRICTCGGKNVSSKALQDERLIQFLMGLNDAYSPARSNILMINPFPSVSLEYSLIMRDEKQREVDIQSHFFRKSASYLATNHKIVGTSDLKGRMTNLLCSHCKKT